MSDRLLGAKSNNVPQQSLDKNRIKRERIEGYAELVDRFGAGEVADAILTKWLSDENADEKWQRLGNAISGAVEFDSARKTFYPGSKKKIPRYLIVLWHLSNGHSEDEIARLMGCGRETVKTHLKRARARLGSEHITREYLVALAIRNGLIP